MSSQPTMPPEKQPPAKAPGLLRSSGLVGIMTMFSRVLGLVRDMVIARYFGAGAGADGGGQRRGGLAPARGVRLLRNERRGIGVRRGGGTGDRGVEPGGQLPQTHHLLAPIHRAMIGSSFR